MYTENLTDELIIKMKEYKERFDDTIPLMLIPSDVEEKELLEKIELSLLNNLTIENYIPEIKIFEDGECLS